MDEIMNSDPTRRDRWGRYLVVPPDGGKPVGYTRATTIAKTLDDTSALMSWAERMTAIGLAQRPDLLAQVDDLRNDNKALNRLCEKAKEAGGATVRRDLGTALHSILERSWTDPDYVPPAAHVDDVTAVHRQLELLGLSPVDGMNEQIVVNDTHKVAGTFDLLLHERATGDLVIADIKTGSSVQYGAVGFAIQLAIYATADALYRQGAASDGSEDQRLPMPAVAQDRAIIIHVQPGSGVCQLHGLKLDLALLELAMTVRQSRNLKLLHPIDAAAGVDLVAEDRWIRQRIAAVRDTNPQMLATRWPAHIPPPKKIDQYDYDQIVALIPIIDALETDLELPFPANRPVVEQPAPEPAAQPVPVSNDPDEGPLLPGEASELRAWFTGLKPRVAKQLSGWVREAHEANLPIRVGETPTARRVHLAWVLRYMVEQKLTEQKVRELLAVVLDDDSVRMATLPFGAALGVCSDIQAGQLRELCGLGTTVKQEA